MDAIGLVGGGISIGGLKNINCFTADMNFVIGPPLNCPPLVAAMVIPEEIDPDLDAGFVWLIAAAGLLVGAVWVTKDRRWKLDRTLLAGRRREEEEFAMRHSAAKVIPDAPLIDERFLMPEFPEPSAFNVSGSELTEVASNTRQTRMGSNQHAEGVGRSTRRRSAVSSVSQSRSWPRWLIALTLLFGAGFCGLQASLPERLNSFLLAVAAPERQLAAEAEKPAGLQLIPVDDLDPDDDDDFWDDEPAASADDDAGIITSASGWRMKSVAEFEPGDTILAFNHETGKPEQRTVVRKFERTSDHLRLLDVKSPDGKTQTIKTTDEHPFWLIATGKYVPAGKLRVGDEFRSPSGTSLAIVGTQRESHPEGVPVYNVEVEGHHNYFVAASRDAQPLLAHNTCKVDDLLQMSEKADPQKAWVKYQNGAENAREGIAPALRYDNKAFGGRDYVKFDGYKVDADGNIIHMIDRKTNIMFTDKALRQARKQSAALAQKEIRGIWEVPTEAAKEAARRLFSDKRLRGMNIGNIDVIVVPQ